MEKRVWIRSGVVEELDAKQVRLIELVLENIRFYYRELHGTRPCYRYALSLSQLMKLWPVATHLLFACTQTAGATNLRRAQT